MKTNRKNPFKTLSKQRPEPQSSRSDQMNIEQANKYE